MPLDEPAFHLFVRSTSGRLLGLAIVMCQDRQRAEDLVQTAYEKVYARWGRLDDPFAYARQIVVNSSRDAWRLGRRRPELSGLEGIPEPTQDDPAAAHADRDQLVRLLAQLPRGSAPQSCFATGSDSASQKPLQHLVSRLER